MSIIYNIGIGSVSSVPKTLSSFASEKGLSVEIIKYSGYGKTFKGYALVDSDNNEIVEIEPINRSSGDKWMIKVKSRASDGINRRQSGLFYAKNMSELVKKLKNNYDIFPRNTGFKFRKK